MTDLRFSRCGFLVSLLGSLGLAKGGGIRLRSSFRISDNELKWRVLTV